MSRTNFDVIKGMNVEEMAEFLYEITDNCSKENSCNQFCNDDSCAGYCEYECCKEWLESEVEE